MKRREAALKSRINARVIGAAMAAVLVGGMCVPVAGAAEATSSASGTATASAGVSSTSIAVPVSTGTDGLLNPEDMKVPQEEAIARVKRLFPALNQAEVSNVRLTSDSRSGSGSPGNPIWQVGFSIRMGNSSHGFSAEIDAMTGDLRNVSLPYEFTSKAVTYPPKVDRDQALEIVKDFIKEAMPSANGQDLSLLPSSENRGSSFSPLFGPVMYTFTFQAAYDGVKISGQSVNVSVDGNGDVTSFYSNEGFNDMPEAKPAVTLEQARAKRESDLQVELVYATNEYNGTPSADSWSLLYMPSSIGELLDAQSGQWLNYSGMLQEVVKHEYAKLPESGGFFTPRPITIEEAVTKVTEAANIPENDVLISKSVQQGRDGSHDVIQLRWRGPDGMPMGGRYAQVDAQTGQWLTYQADLFGPGLASEQSDATPALPRDQVVKLADEWFLKNIPGAADYRRVVVAENPDQAPATDKVTVLYQLFYRDLPVQGRSITLSYDGHGRIAGLYSTPALDEQSRHGLDQLKPAITPEQAKQVLLEATDVELTYYRYGGYYVQPPGEYVEPAVKLVYRTFDKDRADSVNRVLDATTGKMTEFYRSLAPKDDAAEPVDIAGHWAEEALRTLLEHRIVQPDEKGMIHPDQAVTTGAFLRMAALAANPYFGQYISDVSSGSGKWFADIDAESPYYEAVNQWIGHKWLTPDADAMLHPEAELTRDKLAVYVSRMTGYEKISAKLTDLPVFTELVDGDEVSHPGAAALALELGLLTAQDGKFRPDEKVTLAQAAVVLVRMAQHQGEWDRLLMQ